MLTTPHAATQSRAYLSESDPPSKRRILEVALRLFAAKGLHAVTVRDIAGEAGYTNPALFKFFESKDALALHLFERCYLDLHARLSQNAGSDLPFRKRMNAMVNVVAAQIESDAAAFLFVQDHLRVLWPRVSKTTKRHSILGFIDSMLRQGVQEGAVSSTANLQLLVAAIVGTCAQFARMVHFGEFKGSPRDHIRELERLFRRMTSA